MALIFLEKIAKTIFFVAFLKKAKLDNIFMLV